MTIQSSMFPLDRTFKCIEICNWQSRLTHGTQLSGTCMMSPDSTPRLGRFCVKPRATETWLNAQKTPLFTPKKTHPVECEPMSHCLVANNGIPVGVAFGAQFVR